MDKSQFISAIKNDILVGGLISVAPTVASEYLIKKPRKTNEEILIIARDAYVVSVSSSITADVTEFVLLNCQKKPTYWKRLLTKFGASTTSTLVQFAVRRALGNETDFKRDVLYTLPKQYLGNTVIFMISNIRETAEIIKPYAPELANMILKYAPKKE